MQQPPPRDVVFQAALQLPTAEVAAVPVEAVVPVPLPYRLPPRRYGPLDVPWVVDVHHGGADATGRAIDQSAGLPIGISEGVVPAYYDDNN
jgi:hypothetical protein